MIVQKIQPQLPASAHEDAENGLGGKNSEAAVALKESNTAGVGLGYVHFGTLSDSQDGAAPFALGPRLPSAAGQDNFDDHEFETLQGRSTPEGSAVESGVDEAAIGGDDSGTSIDGRRGPPQDDDPMSSGSPRRVPDRSDGDQPPVPQSQASQFTAALARTARSIQNESSPAPEISEAVNLTPTDITFTGGTVAENSAAGTVVATMEAVDPDSGDSFTYSLVGGDTNLFEVQDNQIVVRDGAVLDFESAENHSVTVQVADSAGNTYAEMLDIAVQDVADTIIYGTGAADSIVGTGAAEIIQGFGGNDVLNGVGGNDVINGHRGADKLIGGAGDDDIDGGSGNDTLYGGDGNDSIYGGTKVNGKNAEIGGNDTLFGQVGDDLLDGGDGNDTISGGVGDDVLIGGVGADDLAGDDGSDTASYVGSSSGVNVDISSGTGTGGDAEGDTLTEIENVTGSDYADTLVGGASDNVLIGGSGDDALNGGAGDDILVGGADDDILTGGLGDDHADGGAGNDLFIFGSGDGSDQFEAGSGWTDTISLQSVPSGGSAYQGWVLQLDGDSHIEASGDGALDLSSDAAGMITFDDGSELSFSGVDQIQW